MRLLFELSGEHPTLPKDELAAVLAGLGVRMRIERAADRVYIVEAAPPIVAKSDEPHAARVLRKVRDLALTHRASQYLFTAPAATDALMLESASIRLPGSGSFAVRAERAEVAEHTPPAVPHMALPDEPLRTADVARALGKAWGAGRDVDLEDPDLVVRALLAGPVAHVGILSWENDRGAFEARASRHRPFFSPVSGHPRLMRACVNLARAPEGGVVYDPLCGTGGILLEAGLMGYRAVGSDLDPRMVEGTAENLAHWDVRAAHLFACDVRAAPDRFREETGMAQPDAIVTDLPYGQSASTREATPEDVATWTFEATKELLATGSHAVIGMGERRFLDALPGGLEVEDAHDVRAHKTRTRTYAVLRRR